MSCLNCMSANGLNHRVTIYDPVVAADAEGQLVDGTPSSVVAVWAKKEAVSGGETRNGLQMEATATHLFTIRYRTGLQHDYYIEDEDSVQYQIIRISDKAGTKSSLMIQAKNSPA